MKRLPRRPGRSRRGVIFFIMLISVVLVFALDAKVAVLLRTAIESQAQKISTAAINEAVMEVLGENQVTYQNIIKTERDENGRIISMDTDAVSLNALKAKINLKIQEKLKEYERQQFSIPIGTRLGSDLLRDRGPAVPLRCTLLSNVQCDFKNEFDSAGINQTRHSIMLVVKTEVRAMIPGYETTLGLTTDFCVAETIIVGEVPGVYAGLNGTQK